MVLYNFRADRMVEISKAFEYEDFSAFDRQRFPKVLHLQASASLRRNPGLAAVPQHVLH